MTSITINSRPEYAQTTVTVPQSVFTYDWPVYDATFFKVYVRPTAAAGDDSAYLKTYLVDYTVTGVGNENGGTIVFNTAVAAGNVVTIKGDATKQRTQNYEISNEFTPQDVNRDINNVVIFAKENDYMINNRALRYQDSETITTGDYNVPKLSASQIWKMNATGTAIIGATIEEDPDCSTLRSELKSEVKDGDGALIVGYYDALGPTVGGKTVNNKLTSLQTQLNAFSGADPKVKVTSADTTQDYLNSKIASGNNGLATSVASAGANEVLTLTPLLPRKHISGLSIVSATDADHDVTISPGSCADSTGTRWLTLTSALTKQIDAAWTAGTNQGGRPAAVALSANTTYHVFLIENGSGTVDAGFDTAIAGTNLLAASTYTYYGRIGSVLTDSSANIIHFDSCDGIFMYRDPVTDYSYSGTSPPSGVQTLTVSVPSGFNKVMKFGAYVYGDPNVGGGGTFVLYISSANGTPTSSLPTARIWADQTHTYLIESYDQSYTECYGSNSIKYEFTTTITGTHSAAIETCGWVDERL